MAKAVTKAAAAKAKITKADKPSVKVSGMGFSKTFSKADLKKIHTQREEMRARLRAAG